MTERLDPRMTDDALDRLIKNVLAERAEDVASLAVPTAAMAERIATGTRPVDRARTGLVLVVAVALLLIGIVAAAVVGWRPTPLIPLTFDCEALPQVGDQLPDEYSVRDETGLISGCRTLESDDALAIRGRFGPPLASFDDVTLDISNASADSKLLLVIWTKASCVLTASPDPTGPAEGQIKLEVADDGDGRCSPVPARGRSS